MARIGDAAECLARVNALVMMVLVSVMAQRRSVRTAMAYVKALSQGDAGELLGTGRGCGA